MRNVLKATTIENKLPLLAVENGCIISKDADVTVCSSIAVNVSGSSELTYGTSSPECHPDFRGTTSGSSSITPR